MISQELSPAQLIKMRKWVAKEKAQPDYIQSLPVVYLELALNHAQAVEAKNGKEITG
tara:strand:+ start:322 stop:492 length:171 start_codon:yes stop_codon:yes gene_type:complete